MNWPNNEAWGALREGALSTNAKSYVLTTVDCGLLKMPSGKLVTCDPFAGLQKQNNNFVQIPAGNHKVIVTLADVSEAKDGSHIREAYASLIIQADAVEEKRELLCPSKQGHSPVENLAEGDFIGFPVDAGTACFVDDQSVEQGMPDPATWYEGLFENEKEDCWFNLMDSQTHIRNGIANIDLPESKSQENLILFHSGWGDGVYPVIGGYDDAGQLVAVHIDFMVIDDLSDEDESEETETLESEVAKEVKSPKPWWKFW
jgi:hypothetical protein